MISKLRNIAIIAHVDHGKTTLVDEIAQAIRYGLHLRNGSSPSCIMDSNDLERERGITILSKNTRSLERLWRINIVDTPGHADFGGEVERVSVDGRFGSAARRRRRRPDAADPLRHPEGLFNHGLHPIVVINKIDRDAARGPTGCSTRPSIYFDRLGATDEQLDFPVIYTSAIQGTATLDLAPAEGTDIEPLFETIVDHVPPPDVDPDGPSAAADQLARLFLVRRRHRHRPHPAGNAARCNDNVVTVIDAEGETRSERACCRCSASRGSSAIEVESATAGDIIAFSGIDSAAYLGHDVRPRCTSRPCRR